MLRKLLSLGIVLGLAFSILLPSSFVHAETEDEEAETEEEANDEEANEEEDANEGEEESDEEGTTDEEEEAESTAAASDEPEDLRIYFYVVGFIVVLVLVMYAFTEGMRRNKK